MCAGSIQYIEVDEAALLNIQDIPLLSKFVSVLFSFLIDGIGNWISLLREPT